MEEYKVKIFPFARIDALDLVWRLNTLATEQAVQLFELFSKKIDAIAKDPFSCVAAKDTQLRLRGYRILQVDIYTIFFVVKDKTVELRRILFSKQQYQWLL